MRNGRCPFLLCRYRYGQTLLASRTCRSFRPGFFLAATLNGCCECEARLLKAFIARGAIKTVFDDPLRLVKHVAMRALNSEFTSSQSSAPAWTNERYLLRIHGPQGREKSPSFLTIRV